MSQFKRVITRLLRVRRGFPQPPAPLRHATVAANVEVSHREHIEPFEPAPLPLPLEIQAPPPPPPSPPPPPPPSLSTDTIAEVEDAKDDLEEDVSEDEDIPETFPFDLSRKVRMEMMVHSIYVAISDSEREIAALRTPQGQKFTHVIRVTFEPVSDEDENITPSSWSWKTGSRELRLRCPVLSRNLGEGETALSVKQLVATRDYIYYAMPAGDGDWEDAGEEVPSWREGCKDSKILIIGPPDRSVDVMAILVSYLTFLTDQDPLKLLGALRRVKLNHEHWQIQTVGAATLQLAKTVANR